MPALVSVLHFVSGLVHLDTVALLLLLLVGSAHPPVVVIMYELMLHLVFVVTGPVELVLFVEIIVHLLVVDGSFDLELDVCSFQ